MIIVEVFYRGKPFWKKQKTEKQVCFSVFSGVTMVTVTLEKMQSIFCFSKRVFPQQNTGRIYPWSDTSIS